MGLDAQVIAVGQFSEDVARALEYGPAYYAGVSPGTTVVTNVFVAGDSATSHALAAAFGVGAMDLGRHALQPKAADSASLTSVFGEDNVAQFQLLAEHGFAFYYLPNA
jgi:hypothetical protein